MKHEWVRRAMGWTVLVQASDKRRWEPFRKDPWAPSRVYWAIALFLQLRANGCSVRLMGPGWIVAAEHIRPKERTNFKRRLNEIESFLSKTNDLAEPKNEWEREAHDLIRRARSKLQKEAASIRCLHRKTPS